MVLGVAACGPVLETRRLRLRRVEREDAGPLATLMTQDVSAWLANWPVPFTVEMAAARIGIWRLAMTADGGLAFCVLRRDDAQVMGCISLLRASDDPKRGELSFWLGTGFQGLGYMRECVEAVIAAGFARLGLDVIEGGAQVENAASLAVMASVGMAPMGTRPVFAAARDREEMCAFYEIRRTA